MRVICDNPPIPPQNTTACATSIKQNNKESDTSSDTLENPELADVQAALKAEEEKLLAPIQELKNKKKDAEKTKEEQRKKNCALRREQKTKAKEEEEAKIRKAK